MICKEVPRWTVLFARQLHFGFVAVRSGTCVLNRRLIFSKFSTITHSGIVLSRKTSASNRGLVKTEKSISQLSPALYLMNLIFCRKYGIGTGEYEKLWAAATGGRGVGRGRKKKIKKGAEEGVLNYGKAKISWPGFTSPISSEERDQDQASKPFTDRRRTGIPFVHSGAPRYGNFISKERGWAGGSMGGKHAGAPQLASGEVLAGFDSTIIDIRRVAAQSARGKRRSIRAIVACGNGKGAAGWAIGHAMQPRSAVWKARNKAGNYLYHLPICDNHTIFHDVRATVHKTRIRMERRPLGHGVKGQRIVKAISDLAGYKDLFARIETKCTSPLAVVRATFNCFLAQETHAELAERTGKYVVEFCPEMGSRPIVVASPSDSAVAQRIEREAREEVGEEDELAKAFDPFKGLHRPKQLIQRPPRYVKRTIRRPPKVFRSKKKR